MAGSVRSCRLLLLLPERVDDMLGGGGKGVSQGLACIWHHDNPSSMGHGWPGVGHCLVGKVFGQGALQERQRLWLALGDRREEPRVVVADELAQEVLGRRV